MNKKLFGFTVWGMICLSWVSVCSGEEIVFQREALAYKLKNEALALESSGNYKEALKKLNKSIHFLPDEEAYVARARLYSRFGMLDDALFDFHKALKLNPGSLFVLNERGVVYLKSKEYELAELDFKKEIMMDPTVAASYVNLANVKAALEKKSEAIALLTQALQLNSKSSEAYLSRANIYYAARNFDRAIPDYRRALELNPKSLEAHFNRGISLYKTGQYETALPHFEQAVQMTKQWAVFYCWRGLTYYALEKYEDALEDYTAAPKNDTEGLCYESFVGNNPQKKESDATDVYSQIVRLLQK